MQLKHENSKASLDAGYHTDFKSSASPTGSVLVVKSPEIEEKGAKITVIPRNHLASDTVYPSSSFESFIDENVTHVAKTPIAENDSPAKDAHLVKSQASTSAAKAKTRVNDQEVESNVTPKKSKSSTSKPKAENRRHIRLKFRKICSFGCF
jgi:hypothetical protein